MMATRWRHTPPGRRRPQAPRVERVVDDAHDRRRHRVAWVTKNDSRQHVLGRSPLGEDIDHLPTASGISTTGYVPVPRRPRRAPVAQRATVLGDGQEGMSPARPRRSLVAVPSPERSMQVKAATVKVACRRTPWCWSGPPRRRTWRRSRQPAGPAPGPPPPPVRPPARGAAAGASSKRPSWDGVTRLAPKSPRQPGTGRSGATGVPSRAPAGGPGDGASSSRFVLADAERLPVTT